MFRIRLESLAKQMC